MSIIAPDYYNSYNILSIDPGSFNTGFAVIHIENNNIVSIFARTIEVNKINDRTGLDSEAHSEKNIRLNKLRMIYSDILERYKPIAVVCESPFYNRAFPAAYGSLLTVMNIFQNALMYYNCNIPFFTMEPLLVKALVGAGFKKGKSDVKLAVSQLPEIMTTLTVDLNSLDEHSIDAIAVGYSYLKKSGF